MNKRIMIKILLIILVCFMFAMTAFAADLSVTVNKANNTLTITNTLGKDLYVMDLVSGGKNLPLNVKLNAGATVSFQLSAPVQTAVDNAKCVILGPAPDDYQKGADGFYHLSVNYIVM